MPKQRNKQHAAASAASFIASAQPVLSEQSFPQAAITEQQQYGGQLSRPPTKATYSCHRCRFRNLTCDSHVRRPCTRCRRSDATEPCESLPMGSFELFFRDEPHVHHQPIVPNRQYVGERELQLGQRKQAPWEEDQRQVAPWETEAELATWGSVELNGQAVGTAEEPMSITEMEFGALEASAAGDLGPAGAWVFGSGEWIGYGNSGGADVHHY